MPSINFPASPANGDEFVAAGRTWVYDASIPAWVIQPGESGGGTNNWDDLVNIPTTIAEHLIEDVAAPIIRTTAQGPPADGAVVFSYANELLADSMYVAGAGNTEANGYYLQYTTVNDKMMFSKTGTDTTPSIYWDISGDGSWIISLDSDAFAYYSGQDTITPDLVIVWTADGAPPAPTVILAPNIDGLALAYTGLYGDRPAYAATVEGVDWTLSWESSAWKLRRNGVVLFTATGSGALPTAVDVVWEGENVLLDSADTEGWGPLTVTGDNLYTGVEPPTAVVVPELLYYGVYNARPAWTEDGNSPDVASGYACYYDTQTTPTWVLRDGAAVWAVYDESEALHPIGLAFPIKYLEAQTGEVSLFATPPSSSVIATCVGQLCRVGDSTPYAWYRWDGDAWVTLDPASSAVPIPIIVDEEIEGYEEVLVKYGADGSVTGTSIVARNAVDEWTTISTGPSPLAGSYGDRGWRFNLFSGAGSHQWNMPTTNGTLALTSNADGTVSYDDLVDVPEPTPLTASKVVANAAARLALTTELAEGFAIVDADTGKTWMLVADGTPATSGDWLQLGDRDIQWGDVGGSTAGVSSAIAAFDGTQAAAARDGMGLGTAATLDSSLTHSAGQAIIWDTDLSTTHDNLGLGTAATEDASTTGGANKVAQYDASAYLKTGATNASQAVTPAGGLRIPARQRITWEGHDGNAVGNMWAFPNHGSDFDANPYPELVQTFPRWCWYWTDGMQFGDAPSPGTQRGFRHAYFNPLGAAHAPGTYLSGVLDSVVESISLQFRGNWWTGSVSHPSAASLQYVPDGVQSGELGIFIGGPASPTGQISPGGTSAYGRITAAGGHVKGLGITEDGIRIPTGKSIYFEGSGTSMTAAATGTVTSFSAGTTGFSVATATTTPTLSGTLAVANGGTGTTSGSITPTGNYTITQNSVAVLQSDSTSAVATIRLTGGKTRLGPGTSAGVVGGLAGYPWEVATQIDSNNTTGEAYVDSNGTLQVGRLSTTSANSSGRIRVQDRLGAAVVDFNAVTATHTMSGTFNNAATNNFTNTTDSTSSTTGAAKFSGGVGIAKKLFVGEGITFSPAASATPASNGQLTFEATSNTSVTVKLKGTDGTVRSIVLTLA